MKRRMTGSPVTSCADHSLNSHAVLLYMRIVMKISLLLLVIFVCVTVSALKAKKSSECKRVTSVADHVLLALQWPPGVCLSSRRRCRSSIDRFTIHGTWPNFRNSSGPAFCCGERFDASRVTQQVPDLQSKWGTLFPGSDSAFWQHEWDKHGTCAMTPKLRGQIQYFKQTVQLLDDLHIMDWLRESGIIPLHEKDNRSYATSLIHRSLENHTDGKRIRLDCKRIRQSNEAILVGFHVCYAPLTLEFTDCPGRGDGRCGSHVRFVRPFSTSLVANNPVTSAPSLSDPQGEHETFLDSDE